MNTKFTVVLAPRTPSVGLIAPQVGMPLVQGTLTAVSGNVLTVTRPACSTSATPGGGSACRVSPSSPRSSPATIWQQTVEPELLPLRPGAGDRYTCTLSG